jgi:hypothetical protein
MRESFVPHFIPTSSSWVNLVERWFGELTQKAVRRGAFASVPDLVETIEDLLAAWNENPPFVWTAKLEDILKKIERAPGEIRIDKTGAAPNPDAVRNEKNSVASFGDRTLVTHTGCWSKV